MKLVQDHFDAKNFINAFNDSTVTVADKIINKSVIITPNEIIGWDVKQVEQLSVDDWLPVLDHHPEILLLSTGLQHKIIPHSVLMPLYQQHIGIETMNFASACRTYNILAMENRKVAVALIFNE